MKRRDFLKVAGTGMAALTAGPIRLQAGPDGTSKPNVLFIAIDDLNDWIGCLGGHPDVKTPNLDALAARGVLFTSAYCAAPACNPSRAALMTGIRPATSGVYHNSQPWRKSAILKDVVTIPQHFMAHGYSATGAGKIYHDAFLDPPSWMDYWPSQTKSRPDDPTPPEDKLPLNGIPDAAHFDWGPVDVSPFEMGDWQVADRTIEHLRKKHDTPFFRACGFFRPHLPWYVPPKYFEQYPLDGITLPIVKDDDLDDVPPIGKSMAKPEKDHANVIKYDQWRKAVQAYLASISFMDECVGRVIQALDESAYRDNTIIVLWSDHGWHLGEKLHWRKFALWEEATHNVLMVIAPGVTSAGGRCDAPVNLLDIYPTLIDLCNLDKKPELEGVSLLPLLKNPYTPWDRPALTTHGRNNHSVRSARWRYIQYSDKTEELYDHSKDTLEWTNLAGDPQYTAIKADLQKWLPSTNAEDVPSEPKKPKGTAGAE
ncbi:MAG TPA: sulfatase [bacterium]|nr:sulfatase [bacterium]HQO34462.1 sulfatase [bacterium]HQP99158.1 sulfatase [bacterium]